MHRIHEIASENAAYFATKFYDVLIKDPQAQQYLSHEQVKNRLHNSLQEWIKQMCSPDSREIAQTVYERQAKVGEIHARTGVPVSLVLKGARLLKQEFANVVFNSGYSLENQLEYIRVFFQLLDLSMEAMCEAYATSVDQKIRSSEAYRLFSLTENVATERERQRAALLDWESKFMFETAIAADKTRLPKIRESEFGLWFRHKGMYAFQGATEVDVISECMGRIDDYLLPKLIDNALAPDIRSELIYSIREKAENILAQMNSLFARSLEVESGKDVLTGLLNRRFLPSILSREIEFCRQHGRSFSLLSIDVDHFKSINDNYGHDSGDTILVEIANIILARSRGGDFVFRMGGEEFLLLLVDISNDQALKIAERLRQTIESADFSLPNKAAIKVTVSIGVTSYNGHPDYQYLMRKVDRALYEAKRLGRNQVCVLE